MQNQKSLLVRQLRSMRVVPSAQPCYQKGVRRQSGCTRSNRSDAGPGTPDCTTYIPQRHHGDRGEVLLMHATLTYLDDGSIIATSSGLDRKRSNHSPSST